MVKFHSSPDSFTLVTLPRGNRVFGIVEVLVGTVLIGWQIKGIYLDKIQLDRFYAIAGVLLIAIGAWHLFSAKSTKLMIDLSIRRIYLVKTLLMWRSVRSFEFDEVPAEGMYVRVETKDATEGSTYTMWLRPKFEPDIQIGPETSKDWNRYNEAVEIGNKYLARANDGG